jgi:hypothetical protein
MADHPPPSDFSSINLRNFCTDSSSIGLLSHLLWFFKKTANALAPSSLALINACSGPPAVDV